MKKRYWWLIAEGVLLAYIAIRVYYPANFTAVEYIVMGCAALIFLALEVKYNKP